MERLTFEGDFCTIAMCRENPCPYNGSCSQREVWERLKAYEDTGLGPWEVKDLAGKQEKNEPLTLDELLQMDGEPVRVDSRYGIVESQYCILKIDQERPWLNGAYLGGTDCTWFDCEHYGRTWLAYRHKPKEKEGGNNE